MGRPNAGGGRNNKGKNNVSARARFSKAPKNLIDRIKKKGIDRAVRMHEDQDPKRSSDNKRFAGNSTAVRDIPLDKKQIEQKGLERLNLSQSLLSQLLTLFEGPRSENNTLTVRPPKSITEYTPPKSGQEQYVKKDKNAPTVDIKEKLPFALSTATSSIPSKDRSSNNSFQSTYSKYGFLPSEVKHAMKQFKFSSENDTFLALLISSREHSAPTKAEISSTLPSNISSDLDSEIEVLSSIYGSDVFHEIFFAFGYLPCCRVSVLIEINDVNFEIRMFIVNAGEYPNLNSRLYGWLIDPVAISLSKSVGVTHTSCMTAESMRKLSLDTMEKIQYYHVQVETPVAFDFIQSLNESVPEYMSMQKKNSSSTTKRQSHAGSAEKNTFKAPPKSKSTAKVTNDNKKTKPKMALDKNTGTESSKSKKTTSDFEEKEEELSKKPKLPPMPVTFHIRGEEYRAAYSAALAKGLERSAAQALSVLFDLRKEIEYDEAKMNMSFSISKNISTKEVIEGAKVLSDKLNVNKASGKGLYLDAKDALLASGDEYARTESLLKKKIVDFALDLQKKRIGKKEEKRKEKEKQKELDLMKSNVIIEKGKSRLPNRGLTIRDAYEIAETTKTSAVKNEDSFQDEDGDENGCKNENDIFESDMRGLKLEHKSNSDSCPLSESREGGILKSSYGKCSQAEVVSALQNSAPLLKKRPEGPSNEQLELEGRRLRNLLNNKKCLTIYKEWLHKRSRLPAYQMKAEILEAINSNSVVVISGDTGCGKTTQVPQLVLDDYIERGCGALCNIIVTQPRRISAVSVAEQIARERAEKIGLSVGYHIRLENVRSDSTRLLLMTTGVLLRKLQADDCNLEGVSHIFVDEVHERDINTDFLLIVLKKMLLINPHIKIILMSATLNASLFIDYFRNAESPADAISCALITIPGRAFPVNDFYLEDVLEEIKYEITKDSDYAIKTSKESSGKQGKCKNQGRDMDEKEYRKSLSERHMKEQHIAALRKLKKYSEKTLSSLLIADESIINLELIQKLVVHILSLDDTVTTGDNVGAILIFVPGIADIRSVIDCLNERPEISNSDARVKVFPLHSSLSSQEQSRVFQILPNRARKIIVSTNIAETSVTIEDVVFVIDTCRVKENSYDDESQMNVLQEEFISQANARQRRGRAGRVRSGVCFHLVSRHSLDNFAPFTIPEMLRMSLEDLILQVLALDLGDPYIFLGEALSPPEQNSITSALLFLESLSAVNIMDEQMVGNAAKIKRCLPSEITPLGFHLAALPISPRLGKLLLYGVLLKCIDPILTIISTVSAKSPFISSFEQRDAADMAKQNFIFGNSDLLSAMRAFDSWKSLFGINKKDGGRFNKEEDTYCKVNFLSVNSLKLIDQMRSQFLDLLKDIGFISSSVNSRNVKDCDENSNGSNIHIIKCALCAGLSPNILMIPPSARDKRGYLNKKLMEVSLSSCRKGYSLNVHPSSIMSDSKEIDSSFVAYLEAMKTSKVYARDVTTISPLTLALFCGKMSANLRTGVVVVNGWLTFTSVPDLSRCILYVRDEMENAFIQKVLNPDSSQSEMWNKVLDILKQF